MTSPKGWETVKLTRRRSVQHGIAANMSYEYMVPMTRDEPSQGVAQYRHLSRRPAPQPSRQVMHTADRYWVLFSNRTWKLKFGLSTSSVLITLSSSRSKFSRSLLTSRQDLLCCLGLRKNVPSTSGYRSKTSMGESQRTQATRDMCMAARVDRMKQRVSSLPWLPSSSIWKKIWINQHWKTASTSISTWRTDVRLE